MGDHQFWSLSEALSEPPGAFTLSFNFVSNEPRFADNARWLRPMCGVYIGVGQDPEGQAGIRQACRRQGMGRPVR